MIYIFNSQGALHMKNQRLVLGVLASSLTSLWGQQAAIAQSTVPLRPIPVYWDASDATNRAESRQYAALVWQAEDLGEAVDPDGDVVPAENMCDAPNLIPPPTAGIVTQFAWWGVVA